MRRHALGFLGANALCVGLAALTGAMAHLVAASLSPDLYSIAIGDGLLPPSPVDSMLWGPILIGAFVSWWFGFIAAPFVFAAGVFGPRRSLVRPFLWFAVVAAVSWGAAATFVVVRDPSPTDFPTGLLLSLLGPGYLVLGLAFAALTVSRWRGRDRRPVSPPGGAYPRPSG